MEPHLLCETTLCLINHPGCSVAVVKTGVNVGVGLEIHQFFFLLFYYVDFKKSHIIIIALVYKTVISSLIFFSFMPFLKFLPSLTVCSQETLFPFANL